MRNHTIHPQLEQVFSASYLSQLQKVTFQKGDYICTQGQAITEPVSYTHLTLPTN